MFVLALCTMHTHMRTSFADGRRCRFCCCQYQYQSRQRKKTDMEALFRCAIPEAQRGGSKCGCGCARSCGACTACDACCLAAGPLCELMQGLAHTALNMLLLLHLPGLCFGKAAR